MRVILFEENNGQCLEQDAWHRLFPLKFCHTRYQNQMMPEEIFHQIFCTTGQQIMIVTIFYKIRVNETKNKRGYQNKRERKAKHYTVCLLIK